MKQLYGICTMLNINFPVCCSVSVIYCHMQRKQKTMDKKTNYFGYIHIISLIYIERSFYGGKGINVSGGKTRNEYFAL